MKSSSTGTLLALLRSDPGRAIIQRRLKLIVNANGLEQNTREIIRKPLKSKSSCKLKGRLGISSESSIFKSIATQMAQA
jgi:hypothetical protein